MDIDRSSRPGNIVNEDTRVRRVPFDMQFCVEETERDDVKAHAG